MINSLNISHKYNSTDARTRPNRMSYMGNDIENSTREHQKNVFHNSNYTSRFP